MNNLGITADKFCQTAEWYEQVCLKAEIVEFGEIKGTMVIRPKGFYIWQKIQEYFNKNTIEKRNVDNCSFPLFIPEKFFKKEAEHAEGFAPELAWAATALDEPDQDKAIIRPTSETIIVDSFKRWLRTYRDLPIKVNQWCNIVRWEVKQTKLFLRSREFLWQEGHCIYETEEECLADVTGVLDDYVTLAKDLLALPTLVGEKTEADRFAGAKQTFTFEAFMPDGKALQAGTSHNLGQGFTEAFGVEFTGKDEKQHIPFYNSWGISTRLIGATIMRHSDQKGLVLPPKIVKNKIVIIPAKTKDEQVVDACHGLAKKLSKYNAYVDDREGTSMGFKLNDAELFGVPLAIIIGGKELESGQVTIKVRDLSDKQSLGQEELLSSVDGIFSDMHMRLYDNAKADLDGRIVVVSSLDELKQVCMNGKIAKAHFLDEKTNEEQFEEAVGEGIGTRCIAKVGNAGTCIFSGKPTDKIVYFSRSY